MAILVLISRADPASCTIRDALLAHAEWDEVGTFDDLPVRRSGELVMAEVAPLHLWCDHIDCRLQAAGHAFDTILFASKHVADSGKPALTVHPIGNYGEAEVGGVSRRVCPTDPVVAGRILRALSHEARDIKHETTFEATHHGPYVETPAAFVEIGTDEAAWSDATLGGRVARAILASTEPTPGDEAPNLVVIGGSHYAPRARDLAKKGLANFGHIVPGYALQRPIASRQWLEVIERTPDCAGYYLDPRLVDKRPDEALDIFAGLGLGWWTEDDLRGRSV